MPIYWIFLLMTAVTALLSYNTKKKRLVVEGQTTYRTPYGYALFSMLFIAFFVGMRDVVLDTYAYKIGFEDTPVGWGFLSSYVSEASTGKGFYFIQFVFKNLISEDHYMWFLFMAVVSCLCLLRVIYKYSADVPLSIFLFVANCNFTWLLNGTRQFLAVCILFAFTDWLLEGKKLRYMLLALLVSTVHNSAVFSIPVCLFLSEKEFLSKKMVLFTVIAAIGTAFSDRVFELVGMFLDKDYSDSLASGTGSSMMRLLVAIVPLALSLVGMKELRKYGTPSIILAANMSLVGACFSLAGTLTNGILVGRMPIYFSIYNLYLLPWLIRRVFVKKSSKLVWWLCVGLYTYYFYYQIMVAWNCLPYVSEILGIY